jgi:hypothetical protein
MELDPNIVAIFGPPPQDLDLSRDQITLYNVVTCVILGIAFLVVAMRFYVRNMKSAKLEMDDWAVLVSLVSRLCFHPDDRANFWCSFVLLRPLQ